MGKGAGMKKNGSKTNGPPSPEFYDSRLLAGMAEWRGGGRPPPTSAPRFPSGMNL